MLVTGRHIPSKTRNLAGSTVPYNRVGFWHGRGTTNFGRRDRSERIRTYNYPQGRVTDHRINLTLHKLDFVMDGDLEEITNALIAEHQAELLAAMGD